MKSKKGSAKRKAEPSKDGGEFPSDCEELSSLLPNPTAEASSSVAAVSSRSTGISDKPKGWPMNQRKAKGVRIAGMPVLESTSSDSPKSMVSSSTTPAAGSGDSEDVDPRTWFGDGTFPPQPKYYRPNVSEWGPATSFAPKSTMEVPLKLHDEIVIEGLTSHPDLEGLSGTITKVRSDGKAEIALDVGMEYKAISTRFLRRRKPGDPAKGKSGPRPIHLPGEDGPQKTGSSSWLSSLLPPHHGPTQPGLQQWSTTRDGEQPQVPYFSGRQLTLLGGFFGCLCRMLEGFPPGYRPEEFNLFTDALILEIAWDPMGRCTPNHKQMHGPRVPSGVKRLRLSMRWTQLNYIEHRSTLGSFDVAVAYPEGQTFWLPVRGHDIPVPVGDTDYRQYMSVSAITRFATDLLPLQFKMFILEVPTLRMTVAYKNDLHKPVTLVLQSFANRRTAFPEYEGHSSDRWASGTLSRVVAVMSDRIIWGQNPDEDPEYFSPTIWEGDADVEAALVEAQAERAALPFIFPH